MARNLSAVGAYLRRLREEKELSVTDVASVFGTGEGQIRRIEQGRVDTRFSMMVALCSFLEGNVEDIATLLRSETATRDEARKMAEGWLQTHGDQAAEQAGHNGNGLGYNGSNGHQE